MSWVTGKVIFAAQRVHNFALPIYVEIHCTKACFYCLQWYNDTLLASTHQCSLQHTTTSNPMKESIICIIIINGYIMTISNAPVPQLKCSFPATWLSEDPHFPTVSTTVVSISFNYLTITFSQCTTIHYSICSGCIMS